jgi:hypothetical protein
MILAAAITAAAVAALVAIGEWRHNRADRAELAKINARIDEQTAANNARPHLPHVEVAPIHPPHNPAG